VLAHAESLAGLLMHAVAAPDHSMSSSTHSNDPSTEENR
jgi:hypothetical protein